MTEPLRVGMVGAGAISGQYLTSFDRYSEISLVAVADLDQARAEAVTQGRDGVRALSLDDLLNDAEVEVVLNLTIPAAHAEISQRAIAAGKGVYTEKPLTASLGEARAVLTAADRAGVVLGCAPDTVLGTGIQTARAAVDQGQIGQPVAASAVMVTPGHERWHPNPDFYYLPGGGPLLDMGPYYVTALVHLLGPVVSVIGASSRPRSTRTIGSGPRAGVEFGVEVDSHVTGVLTHADGALSTITMSFDSTASRASRIEVHGTEASLVVPDPNNFDGEVAVHGLSAQDWLPLPELAGYREAGRGIGLVDWATSAGQREPRASGAMGYHVLDVMESLLLSANQGRRVEIGSTVDRPALVPLS